MAAQNEHGRIITAAARTALKPIGCTQVGRSRTWISDQGYWLIVIEFQPSGWGRGTYLNVGAMWLWAYRDDKGFAFDRGHRIEGFVEYESVEQFTPLAKDYARRAADEVIALRAAFPSIASIAARLRAEAGDDEDRLLNAAAASVLAHDFDAARRLFVRLRALETAGWWDYQLKRQAHGAYFESILDEPSALIAEIVKAIQNLRKLNGLTVCPSLTQFLKSVQVPIELP